MDANPDAHIDQQRPAVIVALPFQSILEIRNILKK